jgi:hypothetical protein
MTKPTRIYKHSSAGTDWAAPLLGVGLGLTLSSAVMVGGEESAKWFGQPELKGYRVFAVNRDEESSWEI